MRPLFPGQKEEDELVRIFKVIGTPTEATWPGVEDMPHWKNYDFDQYPARSWKEIVPKLDDVGIDLLEV